MTASTQRKPMAETFDVLVLGGGMAGVAAAIAATRQGARTALVERGGWLGGIGITGATGLHSFFNIFAHHPGVERRRVVAGIAQELVDRVTALGGGIGHVRMERGGDFVSMLTPVEPEVFKLAAARMCVEAGAHLILHTTLCDAHATACHVDEVTVWNKQGLGRLRAKQYVDSTGDGDQAANAGAPHKHFGPGDHGVYHLGFTFRLCNVDVEALEINLERRGMITQLAHAIKPGDRDPSMVRLGIDFGDIRRAGDDRAPGGMLSSSLRPRELTYCNCIGFGPSDGLNVEALSQAEVYLRGRMFEIADVFRDHFEACRQCYVAGPAPAVGPRRGRAIHTVYELTQEDCTEGEQFDDQVGVFGFIDNGSHFVREAGAYGIPYRALLPQGLDNVLIAGRMMTVDLVAHNSTRNTVCCLACGQAAGTAAALSAREGVSPTQVEVASLRERLRDDGVLLEPQADPIDTAA